MRRRAALLTTMTIALMAASSVALAADITCPNSIGNLCIGTNKADTMTGTSQEDDMGGLNGADTMLARGGADTLFGGGGSDDISAGSGDDPSIRGGTGDDILSGGSGNDTYVFFNVRGSWGADRIPLDGEGAGMDELDFSILTDSLHVDLESSTDRDEVASDAGMLNFPQGVEIENVTGGVARDIIRGNELRNRFSGSDGNDELVGRGNVDTLSGDLGADALDGGEGNDVLSGGPDNDAYLFQNSWGEDTITEDALGTDRLFFGQLTSSVTVDLATGTASDGTNTVTWTPQVIENVIGGTANDGLSGNASDNTLNGQGGDDTIYGRDGNDTMFGGPGVDRVNGDHQDFPTETGDDTIDVADGDAGDIVDCGPGTDKVSVNVFPELSGSGRFADQHTHCELVVEEEPINPGT